MRGTSAAAQDSSHDWWDGAWELTPEELSKLYALNNVERFLATLALKGVQGVQKELFKGNSKKETRMAVIECLQTFLDDAINRKDGGGDILSYARELRRHQKPGPATHAAEMLEIIVKAARSAARSVSDAAKSVGASIASGAKAVAKKMSGLRRTISGFFKSVASKIAAAGIEGSASIVTGFSSLGASLDRGKTDIAHGATLAGLIVRDAATKAGAAVQTLDARMPEITEALHAAAVHSIAPAGASIKLSGQVKQAADKRSADIVASLERTLDQSGRRALASMGARETAFQQRQDTRKAEREAREAKMETDLRDIHRMSPTKKPAPPRVYDDFEAPAQSAKGTVMPAQPSAPHNAHPIPSPATSTLARWWAATPEGATGVTPPPLTPATGPKIKDKDRREGI